MIRLQNRRNREKSKNDDPFRYYFGIQDPDQENENKLDANLDEVDTKNKKQDF